MSVAITLQLIGALVIGHRCYRLLDWITLRLLPEVPLTRYQHSPEAWSLVTGASAGIGLGFAQELASRGFNIVLLGHKSDELDQAKTEILNEFPHVNIRILVLDAISATPEDISAALEQLSHLKLTVLVNNVGGLAVSPSLYYRRMDETSADEMNRVISLNARFMAQLTRSAIPYLSKNGPSVVLNVGSASMLGMPGVATYSGCKSFVTAFTKATAREMKADGIPVDVLGLILGEVQTQVNAGKLPLGSPNAREFANAAMSYVGRAVSRGYLLLHPWTIHALQDAMMGILPEWAVETILRQTFHRKQIEQSGLKAD